MAVLKDQGHVYMAAPLTLTLDRRSFVNRVAQSTAGPQQRFGNHAQQRERQPEDLSSFVAQDDTEAADGAQAILDEINAQGSGLRSPAQWNCQNFSFFHVQH